VADEGDQSRSPGWYPAGATPNEQLHWDGQRWTARRRWVHSAWIDVPMEDSGREQPTSSTDGHRWSTTTVVLLVVALAGLGGIIFALVSGVNSAPTPKSTSVTTSKPAPTSTPTSVSIQQASEAEVAACESDAKDVEIALAAFQAQKGAYPSPPAPWSAATYADNYSPLTSGAGGGPYLQTQPRSATYVVEYDSSGHVWVAPPGAYDAYNRGQDFDANPDVCQAAVG